jgi:hypothetical protein
MTMSCLIVAPTLALAQAPPSPATPPAQAVPPSSAPANCAPPARGSAAQQQGATTGEALGDRLARSDGVLCPPSGVDPEIRAPTPDTGNTPVIPPPGSPGGDPTVRPK